MAYSSGFLNKRVTVLRKVTPTQAGFGSTTEYRPTVNLWANVTWLKGAKRLAEASLDAMDTVMIRMRWNDYVTRDVRLQCEGKTYQVQSLHEDRQANELQVTCTEIVK